MKDIKILLSHKPYLLAVLVAIFVLLTNSEVFAASADAPRQPVAGAGLFIAFAIAYLSRRHAIGGWLLYFYIQLYLSLFISLIFIPQVLSNLSPSQWDNSLLYVMFFLSVVPVLAVQLLELVAATVLLFRRNEQYVKYLRNTLIALVVTSAAALAIDVAYFSGDPAIFFDVLTLVFAIIWALYFSKAKRIQMVFIDRSWVYTSYSERRALSQEDKKKLLKRALVSALVTFILFLLMMGSTLKGEGKQPDVGIFAVPLFCAVVAAIIAWYLPIKKKKKETDVVNNTEPVAEEEHDT